MPNRLIAMPVHFWRSVSGRELVRNWLREQPAADRAVIGSDLRRLQFGWPIGMPLVRALKGGIWEIRSSLPSKREARLLFAVDGDHILILHGFIKKSQKARPEEIELARQRLKEALT